MAAGEMIGFLSTVWSQRTTHYSVGAIVIAIGIIYVVVVVVRDGHRY